LAVVDEPARGYSWPPFERGNQAALQHGAYSERRIKPIAETLQHEIVAVAPWLNQPAFAPAVAAWARAEAAVQLLVTELDKHGGLLEGDGTPRKGTNYLERLEARARKLRTDLGLTPQSWAGLLSTLEGISDPQELADLQAIGRRILEEQS
jgi:hypothetical protein